MPLAVLADPFDHDDVIFELKYDGFRALADVGRGASPPHFAQPPRTGWRAVSRNRGHRPEQGHALWSRFSGGTHRPPQSPGGADDDASTNRRCGAQWAGVGGRNFKGDGSHAASGAVTASRVRILFPLPSDFGGSF